MKKRKFCLKLIILTVFFVFIGTSNTLANETSTEDILESQKDSLNISGFLEEADKYTSDLYGDMDVGEIFNKAIKEEIDKCVVLCSNCHRKLHYYNLSIEELKDGRF